MAFVDTDKIVCNAPCGIEEYNPHTKVARTYYPHVDCDCFCETCGWNPAEKERRLKEGVMKPIKKRINLETGEAVKLRKVQHLCFKYPVNAYE